MTRSTPLLLLLALPLVARGEDDPLVRAKAAEERRVKLVEKLAPTVGSFFQGEHVGRGGGSGVIIDPRGYALTNFHVSGTSTVMTVGLNDGKVYRAGVLGIDPGGDIALVKLEGRPVWPYAPLGVSDDVRTGDRVLAMGNPFLLATDFSPTVTEGIVSGVHRFRDAAGAADLVYGDCIQIDASINPGNSGGPLFTEAGQLIGINGLGGFRPDRGRVNVGVGYAASIDQIKNFLSDLRVGRQAEHGTMDASVRDVPLAEDQDLTRPVVDAVVRDSVAWQAGLRVGDVLVEFDGVPLRTQNRFLTLISRLPAGRRVSLTIDRPREDAKGYDRKTCAFRLKGVPSGPEQGKWHPDEKAVALEKAAILASFRRARGGKPEAFRREGVRTGPKGEKTPFVLIVRGSKVRLELGSGDARTVAATDGKSAWLRGRDGKVGPMPSGLQDELQGDAVALDALAREGGERELKSLEFTGGDLIGGKLCDRLETRDRAGRRRRIYLDSATGALAGIGREDEEGRSVEERHLDLADVGGTARPRRIERALDADGSPLGGDEVKAQVALEAEDALFAAPDAPPPPPATKPVEPATKPVAPEKKKTKEEGDD